MQNDGRQAANHTDSDNSHGDGREEARTKRASNYGERGHAYRRQHHEQRGGGPYPHTQRQHRLNDRHLTRRGNHKERTGDGEGRQSTHR